MSGAPLVNLFLFLADGLVGYGIYKIFSGAKKTPPFVPPPYDPPSAGFDSLRPITPCQNPCPDITVPFGDLVIPIDEFSNSPGRLQIIGPNSWVFIPMYITTDVKATIINWQVQVPPGDTCYGVQGPGYVLMSGPNCQDPITGKNHVTYSDSTYKSG